MTKSSLSLVPTRVLQVKFFKYFLKKATFSSRECG
ncbi:UNVERIFIED_CONTAM: hypothetical protein GTU68_059669 [Idotea baltica]|nr:hypothetical protein [Idotea baltica]